MREHMSAPCFIDMQANGLLANRTLREKRVNAPSTKELYRLPNPYK
jgi:hypothetical protein